MAFFYIMQTIVSFIYLFFVVASLVTHGEECLALFQFKQTHFHHVYESFDDSGWFIEKFESWRKITSNASYSNGSDCCLWDGVFCSSEGHVIGLDLSESSLRGRINSSSSLFKLVHLQKLNLSMNDFTESRIPSEIARLKQLRILDLSNSNFSGQVPKEISYLVQLSVLDLSWNPLKLQNYSLEYLLKNITRLEKLHLSEVTINSSVPHFLANFSSLRSIKLRSCGLQDEFPSSIFHLPQLKYLSLTYNPNLNGSLPEFRNNSLLERLDLYSTGFSGIIPESISNLNHLKGLDLDECHFMGLIPGSISNLTQLTYLGLENNKLQGSISSDFSNFKSLEYLNLGFNNFSGRVDLDTFVGLNKLETLYLGFNQISFVSTNNYTDGSLPNLKSLRLDECNLKEFPAFLHLQKDMNMLTLRGNKIEGLVPVWIWNNSLQTMNLVDLSFNFITGFQQHPLFLPWVNLEAFMIQNNQLRGRLPLPPPTIIDYNLSYNKFTGEIPSSICEAKSLQLLDLSFNNLKGTLPPCFGSLTNSLSVLNLKRNNFHGRMLNAFTHGSMLKMIDLSENHFSGQVSKSITKCTVLEVLSLGDNSFDDYFPSWLGSLPVLQVLILRSNKFHGAIQGPRSITPQFSNLRIIDLSNNSFSGQLPVKYIHSWKAMKSVYVGKSVAVNLGMELSGSSWSYEYSMTLTHKGVKTEYVKILKLFIVIDLSCNKFEGPIPLELQYLQGLESLNLSNNQLTGHILPSFGSLKNLESLDLSQNKLSGKIPQQLLRLGFLSILNFSFNNLDGPIPQGKQFNTFENNSYLGNPGLCGKPLSKECQNSKASTLPPTSSNEFESESLLSSNIIDWIIIFTGVASGLVTGIVVGNILYARYNDWFTDIFGLRKDKWVKPLSNTRRNCLIIIFPFYMYNIFVL